MNRLRQLAVWALCCTFCVPAVAAPPVAAPPVAAPPVAAPVLPAEPASQKLELETSDGLALWAWYYPVAAGGDPRATVILVHDLEGSHKTVEPLAKALQKVGFAVVTPDLRGHGASTSRSSPTGKTEVLDSNSLKRTELEAISAAAGGSVRDQAAMRGDIETVRNWIKRKSETKELNLQRLCLIGSGSGAILAANWTAADWNWLPIASGPQGRQVKALVLISPTWASKGLSFVPALATEGLKQSIPVMVLAGNTNRDDRDAMRVYDRLKSLRPQAWFEQRVGQEPAKAPKLEKAAEATVFFMQLDTALSADKLAADRSANTAGRIQTFLSLVLDPSD